MGSEQGERLTLATLGWAEARAAVWAVAMGNGARDARLGRSRICSGEQSDRALSYVGLCGLIALPCVQGGGWACASTQCLLFRVDFGGFIMYPENGIGHFLVGMS